MSTLCPHIKMYVHTYILVFSPSFFILLFHDIRFMIYMDVVCYKKFFLEILVNIVWNNMYHTSKTKYIYICHNWIILTWTVFVFDRRFCRLFEDHKSYLICRSEFQVNVKSAFDGSVIPRFFCSKICSSHSWIIYMSDHHPPPLLLLL